MSRFLIAIFNVVLLLNLVSFPTVNSTRISLTDNAYSNIVVAISPDVPDTWAEDIINNIQTTIKRASLVLYKATRQRAYFKDVRILIPDSWGSINANVSTWETYSTADIKVAPASSAHGDAPYTIQSGGCYQPGEYIHMTPDYLRTIGESNNMALFGPPDKVFVHEWSHLRYGVFDEFGQQGNTKYPLFYKPPDSAQIIPNLCTDRPPIFTTKDVTTQGPCKINPATGIYDDNCVYSFNSEFQPTSSLMSQYSIDSILEFCEDGTDLPHNSKAPNKHNEKCDSKAVWTVISSHPDFASNNNPPNDIVNLEPDFQIVRSGGSRFILVMDTSGSMLDYDRINRLYESSRRWIKYDISEGSQLGMVEFNYNGEITSPMVLIDGEESRESLIAKLPLIAAGGTCIGCGLLKALELLRPGGQGGVILLITDGEENTYPLIEQIIGEVIDADVRVVSIAFGRSEDKIEELAKLTNGKSYFIDDNDSIQGLNDAFIGSLTYQPAVPSDKILVLLYQRQYQQVANNIISSNFSVDFTVGRNFIFRIDYTEKDYLVSFTLTSPSGTVYTQLEYDETAKVAMFNLDLAEVGNWNYVLMVSNSLVDSLAVHITSLPRSNTTEPITTECYVPDDLPINNIPSPIRILAKVMQGTNPVVQARVKAYVEIPNGSLEIVELYDNGISADVTADDGIYSYIYSHSNIVILTVCDPALPGPLLNILPGPSPAHFFGRKANF